MFFEFNRTVIAAALIVVSATPAWSDECSQPKAAMMVSAKTPYRETIVSPGPGGKLVTSQIVQTATTKYVEQKGRWTSLYVSSADLDQAFNEMLKTGKMSQTNRHRTDQRSVDDQIHGAYRDRGRRHRLHALDFCAEPPIESGHESKRQAVRGDV